MAFLDLSPDELRRHHETVFLRLLLRTSQMESNDLVARLRARGHEKVSAGSIAVLGNVDTEGTRVVTLAGRLGTSRQALSQLVQTLERAGHLERLPDPTDGRAVLVRHTEAGRRLLADALEAMAEIEAGYAQILGRSRFRALKEALADLAAEDPSGALGP